VEKRAVFREAPMPLPETRKGLTHTKAIPDFAVKEDIQKTA